MIILNEKWAIKIDASRLNYLPCIWQEAKEVRVVRTGEIQQSEARYVHNGTYYPTFEKALKGILKHEQAELALTDDNIEGYIQKLESIAENLYQDALKLKGK